MTVPFTADQPFWGRRVAALNAGPAPVPMHELARAIQRAEAFRPGAEAVSRQLASEDGVGAAIAEIRKVG